ncbi:MAG TPA: AAA family ATPase [Bryobacteraceae bacterium]|nr:AAA family ATPase [Bryobacteraceae bacterium]
MKEFLPFRLDTENRWLWRRGETADEERILLTPTAFAVLQYLVNRAGQLVTQDELLQAVWRDTHVQPQAVKRQILDIRSVLGDDPKTPLFIETLPRRGYRFIAAVRESVPPVHASPPRSPQERLVGRERVLRDLRRYLQNALQGEGQILFITGEPGIGKTSVVDEFERRTAAEIPIRISRGQCVEGYGGKEAYYPMLEALGKLCRRPDGESIIQTLAIEAPTWLVQFPALVKREQREMLQREILGATRERMLREIGEALEAITAANPMLLIFEDLQWVDRSTVDFISALARGRAPAKLMLVGTYRPADVALSEHPLKLVKQDLLIHRLCHEIALGQLSESQVTEYLAPNTSTATVPDGLAELVHRHSEGNPLFMVAALDHMAARGLISHQNGAWQLRGPLEGIDLDVPENLREMIEAQIEHLTTEEQRALEVASITGAIFSSNLTAAAANLEEEKFSELCEGLSRRDLMVRSAGSQHFPDATISERYQFVHALYREVFYGRQAAGTRARLHQRIGEQLEELFSERLGEVAAELAHHFEKSRDWLRAVRYLRLVAENAGRRYAHREATTILQHALELVNKLTDSERAAAETQILAKLVNIYLVSFDMRVVETCEALAARAAHYGLVDMEVHALIEMAYPLSWISSERCLAVLERALELAARQTDPLARARTRASCFVRRIWAAGWNDTDAEDCRSALAEIRQIGDRLVLAAHLIDYNFIQWVSSEYREAQRNAVESLAILLEGREENPYSSTAYWLSQFTLPWSLLFLGNWGEMLREIKDGIVMADKNRYDYRAQTLRLYQAWLYFHGMDFDGVVSICESLLPSFADPPQSPWRRLCLILAGSAFAALGNYEDAWKRFSSAGNEMDRQTVIYDWYCRILLELGLTEFWLAKGDLPQARSYAQRLLKRTQATPERTWQALAWEANARVAAAEHDLEKARDCITKALLRMEGWEVPLAAWRVHATGAELSDHMGNSGLAEYHCQLSRATISKLSNSLPLEDPLRKAFLSAPPVRRVLETSYGS